MGIGSQRKGREAWSLEVVRSFFVIFESFTWKTTKIHGGFDAFFESPIKRHMQSKGRIRKLMTLGAFFRP